MIHLTHKAIWARLMVISSVALGALSLTSDSSAASLRPDYSLQELLTDSDAVVVATVAARQVVQALPTGLMAEETLTEIHVRRYLRGSGPPIRIIRQLGDTRGAASQRIASDAKLEAGHTCVLFLRSDATRGVDHLTLLGFSAYELRGQTASPHAELKVSLSRIQAQARRRRRPSSVVQLPLRLWSASLPGRRSEGLPRGRRRCHDDRRAVRLCPLTRGVN